MATKRQIWTFNGRMKGSTATVVASDMFLLVDESDNVGSGDVTMQLANDNGSNIQYDLNHSHADFFNGTENNRQVDFTIHNGLTGVSYLKTRMTLNNSNAVLYGEYGAGHSGQIGVQNGLPGLYYVVPGAGSSYLTFGTPLLGNATHKIKPRTTGTYFLANEDQVVPYVGAIDDLVMGDVFGFKGAFVGIYNPAQAAYNFILGQDSGFKFQSAGGYYAYKMDLANLTSADVSRSMANSPTGNEFLKINGLGADINGNAEGDPVEGVDIAPHHIDASGDLDVAGDATVFGDIAASNLWGTNSGNETSTTVGTLINGSTAKTTPVDADMFGLMDSAGSNILKKLSWANFKTVIFSYLKSYFVQRIVLDVTTFSAVTGTTSETLCGTYTIPANTYSSADELRMLFRIIKPVTASAVAMRVRLATSNSFSTGHAQIALFNAGTTTLFNTIDRTFKLEGGNLRGYSGSTSATTDITNSPAAELSTTFDPTVTNYIFTSIQLANVSDSAQQSLFKILR